MCARDLATRAGPSLVIQAGTATSHRVREQEQSFNLIEVAGRRVTLTVRRWDGEALQPPPRSASVKRASMWRLDGPEAKADDAPEPALQSEPRLA